MKKIIIVHTIIFNKNKQILILKRSVNENVLPNLWDIPGGTLEDGENPIDGATREVWEESGIKIKNAHLFFYTSNIDKRKDAQFIRLIFITQSSAKNIKLSLNEHDKYKWIKISEAKNYQLVDYLYDCLDLLNSKTHNLLMI